LTSVDVGKFMRAELAGTKWYVGTKRGNLLLGIVEWNQRWRQFELVPTLGAAFTWDCLVALGEFLQGLDREPRTAAGGQS